MNDHPKTKEQIQLPLKGMSLNLQKDKLHYENPLMYTLSNSNKVTPNLYVSKCLKYRYLWSSTYLSIAYSKKLELNSINLMLR